LVSGLAMMKYSRDQEKEADLTGLNYMSQQGYDPHEMVRTMEILKHASKSKSQPEFLSTHPNPGNREEYLQEAIQKKYAGERGKTNAEEFQRTVLERQ
jgi:predicted Zn-dependent protease